MNNHRCVRSALPWATFVLTIIFTVVATSGCEPLRKKFTRKKKKDRRAEEFIPVLDPIEYPARLQTADGLYTHHYSLWRVWHNECMIAMQALDQEKVSDRRIASLLNHLLAQLEEMRLLLQGEKAAELERYLQQVRDVREDIDLPEAVRNDYGMQKRLSLVGKAMRLNFRPHQVKDSLVELNDK